MNEKKIRLDAYQKIKDALMAQFKDAFSKEFCVILERNIDVAIRDAVAEENAVILPTIEIEEREQG